MGGGNRNSQSKAERRVERKERRKAAARQNHREKEKIREKEIKEEKKLLPKKPKAWKRRDKDGSIILWNAIKLSKTSAYLLGVMGVIALLFVASPLFEDPNYVEPERYSFAECEAIDFEDMYCIYDFKWTREYADGGTISEYAEFDPFVDLPVLGDKYTEEEQDFLPPGSTDDFSVDLTDEEWDDILKDFSIGNFILFPMAHATHDYLSGYAEHEKYDNHVLNDFGLEFVEDELPEGKEELTKYIEQLRLDLDTLQIEMRDVEMDLQQWSMEEIALKNDKRTAESIFEDAEEDLDVAETAYRHAQDMRVRTAEDVRLQDLAYTDYKVQLRQFASAEKTWDSAMDAYNLGYTQHREQEQRVILLDEELDQILDDLTEARIKLNLVFREFQFISVNLSKTCLTLIQYELPNVCPTYREMVPLFDNTLRNISGEFVEVGYDIKRLPAPLKNHWVYYEQVPEWRVVTVDADPSLFKRGVEITVQAKDFTVIERSGVRDKSDSYDSSTLERTTWKNIHVSEKCDSVTVGPDLHVIEAAILHVLNKCTTDLSEFKEVVKKEPTVIPKEESAQWKYLKWIAGIVESLRDTTVDYVTTK